MTAPSASRHRRVGVFGAAWAAPALLLVLLPGPLAAQSYLSELPGRATIAAGPATTAAADRMRAPLDELFRMVESGQGAEAYPALLARFDEELAQAGRGEVSAVDPLRRRYLFALLKAGEGPADPAEQERVARLFTEAYPDDPRFPQAFFLLNQALFQQGKPLEQSFFFDQDALASLPDHAQTRLLRMLAESAAKRGAYADAAGYLLVEKESRSTLRQSTRGEVLDMLEHLEQADALTVFLQRYEQVEWLRERAPFLEAKVLLNAGRLDLALLRLDGLLAEGIARSEADLKFVNDLKQEVRRRVATRPERIGVLLPIGSSAQVLRELALETLEGLRMAVQYPDLQGPATAPLGRLLAQDLAAGQDRAGSGGDVPRYELVIRDTANSPKRTADQVEALVNEDHVVAIIGPIARAESSAAAEKAEELGVPLISLSLSLEIPPGARMVFRHSKSQEEEVRDLVRYATDYLHSRRYAILFPDTSYGHTMAGLFWGEVESRGGRVVAVASFQPSVRVTRLSRDSLGFKEIFERFTGTNRYISPEEKALLDAVGDSRPDPIVDFDALFIPVGPDGVQDLQLIAPYPVTVDAEHVQILGSRFWNEPSVLVAGDGKLDGAVFVDAFDLTSTNPKVAAFHTRHRAFFGHHVQYRPPTYYAGLGYDTANLLMSLLQVPANRSRTGLRSALVHMEPFFGVTGWTRFRENGEADKETMFFRIKGNDIVRVIP